MVYRDPLLVLAEIALTYYHRPINGALNMRIIYKVLSSQYDPLGYILPFTDL